MLEVKFDMHQKKYDAAAVIYARVKCHGLYSL